MAKPIKAFTTYRLIGLCSGCTLPIDSVTTRIGSFVYAYTEIEDKRLPTVNNAIAISKSKWIYVSRILDINDLDNTIIQPNIAEVWWFMMYDNNRYNPNTLEYKSYEELDIGELTKISHPINATLVIDSIMDIFFSDGSVYSISGNIEYESDSIYTISTRKSRTLAYVTKNKRKIGMQRKRY